MVATMGILSHSRKMTDECDAQPNRWNDDLLGYSDLADAYTNLVQSIMDSKTISIEAGFGRGKTFFRTRWAAHLRDAGELVVEIDAQQSDHSGDPVLTFLGALMELVPAQEPERLQKALDASKKIGGVFAKTLTRAILREGADEVVDLFGDGDDTSSSALENVAKSVGDGMSKLAGDMITAQLVAEQVRKKEIPDQIKALRAVLTEGRETKRIIILIDELDRCHPNYALALLEAMKLVFDQDGFVFVLMVNREYLENLAAHRFGTRTEGEPYLDKFLDLRLALPVSDDALMQAVKQLGLKLPLAIPFATHRDFMVEAAADLAGALALDTRLSFRQIEAVLLKVELALRVYSTRPIDVCLLVILAFDNAKQLDDRIKSARLPRSGLTPEFAEAALADQDSFGQLQLSEDQARICNNLLPVASKTLRHAPTEKQQLHTRVLDTVAPSYLPDHQNMLNSVLRFQVDSDL